MLIQNNIRPGGAEKLLGKGDMLYAPGDQAELLVFKAVS
jgi:DNA segregation ATPase FtsK/SpoIIIE-like protein